MSLVRGEHVVEGSPAELAEYARHLAAAPAAVDLLVAELTKIGTIGHLHVCVSCRDVVPSPVWLHSRACGRGCGQMAVLGQWDLRQPEATRALLALTVGAPDGRQLPDAGGLP